MRERYKYEIGERIKKYRKKLGMSQKELAKLIGVSNNVLSNWEQGLNRPHVDILPKLCGVLCVTPSMLLGMNVTANGISDKEMQVLLAYRQHKELQNIVDKILEIED